MYHFYKLCILGIFSVIYIFPVLGFQGPLRLGSEEDSMRYALNLPLACEKPCKTVIVGYNIDAFSIFYILCLFLCWGNKVSPLCRRSLRQGSLFHVQVH